MHSYIKVKKKLKDLIKDLHPENIKQNDIIISGIETNSKNVSNGDLFIAINGNTQDGHIYINDAIKNGASAAISNKKIVNKFDKPVINIENTRKAASIISQDSMIILKDLTIIGITGTNGKTTTAYLIKECLDYAGFKTAQIGTTGVIAEGYKQEKTLTTPDALTIQKLLKI